MGKSALHVVTPSLRRRAGKAALIVVTKLLESGANPNLQDKAGKTPLYDLLSMPYLMKTLTVSEDGGDTLLAIVRKMEEYGADINLQAHSGMTPLRASIS